MQRIENEHQLRLAIENIDRMYRLGDSEADEPLWDEETRREMSEQTRHIREALESEVALYLANKHRISLTETPSKKSIRRPSVKSVAKSKVTASI